jgi:hypothetical protein
LFSKDSVADYLNSHFEPAWESVRPVPLVRVDFGNGKEIVRTLHGNIVTLVCNPEGQVLDALPGIYDEATYLKQLKGLVELARQERAQPAERRAAWLTAYHQQQSRTIEGRQRAAALAAMQAMPAVTKRVIERPAQQLVAARLFQPNGKMPPNGRPMPADVARWATLGEDTRVNEQARRKQIHDLLARLGAVRPSQIVRPLYKDVLHADLDDPYLGLGKALSTNYPFAAEDAAR